MRHFKLLAPYGIRESTERIGTKKTEPIPEDLLSSHFPMKLQYGLGDIYKDLLNFAAEKLVMNGRLVFWIPIIRLDTEELSTLIDIATYLY